MAHLTYTKALNGGYLQYAYSGYFTFSVAEDQKSAVVTDIYGGSIELSGTGLTANDPSFPTGFSAGTVDELVFKGSEGQELATLEGEYSAKAMSAQAAKGAYNLVQWMLKGNDTIDGSNGSDYLAGFAGKDTIKGKGGADWLDGGAGKDKLTGGASYDTFILAEGSGADVVTDFDFKGKTDTDHDWIMILGDDKAHTKVVKGNLVVYINDQDSLTIQGTDHINKHFITNYMPEGNDYQM
jgi:Ca2+-binding RTX toxin-like protein